MNDKQYFLLLEQENQGCDYTIGCGTTIELMRAKTMEAAINEVMDMPQDWKKDIDIAKTKVNAEYYIEDMICESGLRYVNDDERPMKTVNILEVSDCVDVMSLLMQRLGEVEAYKTEILNADKQDKEKKLYETLKKKYG